MLSVSHNYVWALTHEKWDAVGVYRTQPYPHCTLPCPHYALPVLNDTPHHTLPSACPVLCPTLTVSGPHHTALRLGKHQDESEIPAAAREADPSPTPVSTPTLFTTAAA